MANDEKLVLEKARVVLVGFEKEKDKYNVAKSLAQELGTSFEEAAEIVETIPVELIQPLPIEAARNLAERIRKSGAIIEVVPLSRDLGGGRTCYRHPHKLAMAKCKVCGRLLCNLCLIETKGKLFCKDHFKQHKLLKWIRYSGVSITIVLMVMVWLLFNDDLMRYFRRVMPVSTQRVAMVVFAVNPDTETSKFYNNLMRSSTGTSYSEGDDHTLAQVDGWFQNQFEGISKSDNIENVLDIDVYGLFGASQVPPGLGLKVQSTENLRTYLKNMAAENNFTLTAYDLYLFVFVVKESPIEMDFVENMGIYDGKYGLVLFPLKKMWSNDYYVMNTAHLLAKMLGATSKIDEKGFPIFPEGYADPEAASLYPQPGAELMGAYILTKKFTIGRITSMDEVVIGPRTAYELGWVSKSYVNKAYSDLK